MAEAFSARRRPHFDRLHSGVQRQRLFVLAACLVVFAVLALAPALPAFVTGRSAGKDARPGRRISVAAGPALDDHGAVAQKEANDWRLSIGHAIDILRRDIPHMFDASYDMDYSIFSPSVEAWDARLPSVRMRGLQAYQTAIGVIRHVLRTTCDYKKMEIQSISLPVNGVVYVRWKLQLWPKDPLGPAKDFLNPAWRVSSLPLYGYGAAAEPSILEGYSKYEFDVWSGEVIKHAVEINLPPMLLKDVFRQPAFAFGGRQMQVVPF